MQAEERQGRTDSRTGSNHGDENHEKTVITCTIFERTGGEVVGRAFAAGANASINPLLEYTNIWSCRGVPSGVLSVLASLVGLLQDCTGNDASREGVRIGFVAVGADTLL